MMKLPGKEENGCHSPTVGYGMRNDEVKEQNGVSVSLPVCHGIRHDEAAGTSKCILTHFLLVMG
jgi:hypothetical protein